MSKYVLNLWQTTSRSIVQDTLLDRNFHADCFRARGVHQNGKLFSFQLIVTGKVLRHQMTVMQLPFDYLLFMLSSTSPSFEAKRSPHRNSF